MSKIVSMSSGAIDPIAQTKAVFFRPTTAADVVKIGQLVCYDSDSVKDHKDRTVDPTHLGLTKDTYAEGEQEFTARLFVVEKPKTANLFQFAGVVKSLGPKAGADGDLLQIFVPNGAVVPVYTDVNCTLDVSLLGVADGSYTAEAVTDGEPLAIGLAMETKNRSSVNGLVWARVKGVMSHLQATALTAALAQGTYTAPSPDDFAFADVTTSTPYGLADQDEAQSLIKLVCEIQKRQIEMEVILQKAGLVK